MNRALKHSRSSLLTLAMVFAVAYCCLTAGTACAADTTTSPDTITRYAGNQAVDTAVESSKAAFPDGSDYVILTRDDDFMDSMSATGLAGAYDAPILLTNRTNLSSQTLKEIKRLKAKTVFIIGGEAAVQPAVDDALVKAGVKVTRVFGDYACDTSVACARMIESKDGGRNTLDTAVVATSIDFADALSVSSYAYKYHIPIFITTGYDTQEGDRVLRADAKAIIDNYGTVFVPGGPGALPTSSVEGVWGDKVTRVYGLTGYDTSVAVAKKMMDDGLLCGSSIGVANGMADAKGVDALTASALLAKNNAPLILVEGSTNTAAANAFIGENNDVFEKAIVFGGTYVCPESLVEEIDKALRDVVHYVAVIGSDYWTSSKTRAHLQGSDLMVLLRIDTETATVSCLTIPRDTYYVQKGEDYRQAYPGQECTDCTGKTWNKANYAFHYGYYEAKRAGASHQSATNAGAVKACEAISEIAKVGVTDYIVCDLMTYQDIVDLIGGLDIILPHDIDYSFYDKSYSDVHLDAGDQTLSGFDAMVAARSRVSYRTELGLHEDATRQSLNRQALYRLITAALNSDSLGLGSTGDFLNKLVSLGLVETNIGSDSITAWGNALQEKKDSLVMHGASGPYEVTQYEIPELGYDKEGCLQTLVDYDEEAYLNIAKDFCAGLPIDSGYDAATWSNN